MHRSLFALRPELLQAQKLKGGGIGAGQDALEQAAFGDGQVRVHPLLHPELGLHHGQRHILDIALERRRHHLRLLTAQLAQGIGLLARLEQGLLQGVHQPLPGMLQELVHALAHHPVAFPKAPFKIIRHKCSPFTLITSS